MIGARGHGSELEGRNKTQMKLRDKYSELGYEDASLRIELGEKVEPARGQGQENKIVLKKKITNA